MWRLIKGNKNTICVLAILAALSLLYFPFKTYAVPTAKTISAESKVITPEVAMSSPEDEKTLLETDSPVTWVKKAHVLKVVERKDKAKKPAPIVVDASSDRVAELYQKVFGIDPEDLYRKIDIPVIIGREHQDITLPISFIEMDDTGLSLHAGTLLTLLEPILNPSVYERIYAATIGIEYIEAFRLEDFGIATRLDLARFYLFVQLDPTIKKNGIISLYNVPKIDEVRWISSSDYSGVMNISAGVQHQHAGSNRGVQPLTMALDGALNLKGWVIEPSANYVEYSQGWFLDGIELTRDFEEKAWRLNAGDIVSRSVAFQASQSALGLSLFKEFDIQPYKLTEPRGEDSFLLKQRSEVVIYVNGRLTRRLTLEPGQYNIKDFPITSGINDITLKITDETGRIEERVFEAFTSNELLQPGLQEFGYSIGLPSENGSHLREYEGPIGLSGFHRLGFSDQFTGGANLQFNKEQIMAGMEMVHVSGWGTFSGDIGASYIDDVGSDWTGELGYRYSDANNPDNQFFSASLVYRGDAFGGLGNTNPQNDTRLSIASRYSRKITDDINASVGAQYLELRDSENYTQSSLSGRYRLSRNISLSSDLSYSSEDQDVSSFINLTWTPQATSTRNYNVNTSYNSESEQIRSDVSFGNNGPGYRMNYNAGVASSPESRDYSTGITYTGNRGIVGLNHDAANSLVDSGGNRMQTDLTMQTALVFADDAWAVSQPVGNSFTLFRAHPNLEPYDIAINPSDDGAYAAEANRFGPAVLTNVTPYLHNYSYIDTANIPIEFDPGINLVRTKPGYKSGVLVELGRERKVMIDGYVKSFEGEALPLQSGYIRNDETGERLPFFTNRKGRFRLAEVPPGSYHLKLYRRRDVHIPIFVPEESEAIHKLGTLNLPKEAIDSRRSQELD